MHQISATSNHFDCKVQLPSSKSESNRLLIIKALTPKHFEIKNLSNADDTVTLANLLANETETLNCGSGGTTFRFLLALTALRGEKKILTCSKQLSQRPIKPLVEALLKMGANITYLNEIGFPPLEIGKGDFSNNREIEIEANISSQFISALLLIAPVLPNGLKLKLKGNILSQPYIELTLALMKAHGITSHFIENEISIAPQHYIASNTSVSSDWSAASYFYELAVFSQSAKIELAGLSFSSMQGDKIISELMKPFGIASIANANGITLVKNQITLPHYFEYNFQNCPDLVQTMALLCVGLGIEAKLYGIDNLIHKETNRVLALVHEIKKMGTAVTAHSNTLFIEANPNPTISNVAFNTYEDHRMAMALAPLAAKYNSIILDDLYVVSKSFPNYWIALNQCGFFISEV